MKRFSGLCIALCLVLLAVPVFVFAQGDATAPPPEVLSMFDYDQSAPLDIQQVGSEMRGDVTVQDITFAAPGGGDPIPAYLVLPANAGSAAANAYAGILYLHWYDTSAGVTNSNRTQFLDEAVDMAALGVVSLLPATNWEQASWFQHGRSTHSDFQDSITQVINLRRALDVLSAQHGVDPARIAVVGHDFGSMYGATLGMVDSRPSVFVLIAGTPHYSDWFFYTAGGMTPNQRQQYQDQFAPIDPVTAVPFLAGKPILFQFGQHDEYIAQSAADAFSAAALPPFVRQNYPTQGHPMDSAFVRGDRERFLRSYLNLQPAS